MSTSIALVDVDDGQEFELNKVPGGWRLATTSGLSAFGAVAVYWVWRCSPAARINTLSPSAVNDL
jgi:hypothetical protein